MVIAGETPHRCNDSSSNELDPLVPKGKSGEIPILGCGERFPWIADLSNDIGSELLAAIVIIRHVFWSFSLNLTGLAASYLFRMHEIPGPRVQIYGVVTAFPLAMQPLVALMSDCFPILGANKAPYMTIATFLAAPALLSIGSLPVEALSEVKLVLCLMLAKFQISTCNVLSEARYMMEIPCHPQSGPALVSFVKMGAFIFGIVGAVVAGFLLENFDARSVYLLASVASVVVLIPIYKRWLREPPCSPEDAQTMRFRMQSRWQIPTMSLVICYAAFVLACSGLFFHDSVHQVGVAICVVLALIVAYHSLLDRALSRFLIYFLVVNSFDVSCSGASYYFYTDTPEQYPDGPHFSPFFYVAIMPVISIFFGLLGTVFYLRYLTTWTYRGIISVTVVSLAACRLLDALLFTRWNKYLGIPDIALVLGEDLIGPVIEAWRAMPMTILLAHLCPKGMEATILGLNASTYFIGFCVAKVLGAALLDYLQCNPAGAINESEQFAQLYKVSLISATLICASGLGLLWLLPEGRQNDSALSTESGPMSRGAKYKDASSCALR
eukprot:TRINITY_DN71825_c0_g1_i1.p1 TRINITY_DN71825_c0_g1~~TRINITY_DN71825_c0_g1_i1.p1  ORF type:complete len:553 (+),score=69.71 TRINITY_DN71825_c0_g1_i1:136-1794(+)